MDKHIKAIKREQNTIEKNRRYLQMFNKNQLFMSIFARRISVDKPFNKLSNKKIRIFLEKYTKNQIPDESKLRKFYVDDI